MSDVAERLVAMFEAVLDGMDLDADVRVEDGPDGGLSVVVDGEDDLDVLIGREGSVIDALQYLAHQTAMRAAGEPIRVAVDAGGYRERRRLQLVRLAEHAAREAVEHGEEIELDAMTPHDRRIVHMALAERTDIETRSEGEEPHRRIVVLPAAPAD